MRLEGGCECFKWTLAVPGLSAWLALAEAQATMPEPDVTFLELLLDFTHVVIPAAVPVLPL